MKKPFLFASGAALYIIIIVLIIQAITYISAEETIIIPMVILGLFVLSAAIMGFLFLSEPFNLYMENRKPEAVAFFVKVVGIFAGFVTLFLILLFAMNYLK